MRREYPDAPIVGVGAVVVRDSQVLMVRRAHPPNEGQWSVPGGTVELGETLARAAAREVREECDIQVEAGEVLSTFDLILRDEENRIRYHYVLIDVAARYIQGDPTAATDALEVRWVSEADLDQLDVIPRLLPVLRQALRQAGPPAPSPGH
jgi:8-oxo-dGTP diphosphatase